MTAVPANPAPRPTRPRGMRHLLMAALLTTLLAVAGCGPATSGEDGPGAAGPPDPAALIGSWRVEGGAEGQTVVLDPTAIAIVQGDGTMTGTWRADPAGRFVAQIDTSTLVLRPPGDPAAPVEPGTDWLAAAAGYRIEPAGPVLLDRAGAPVARLVAAPPPPGSGAVDPGRPPSEPERNRFAPAAPVPAALAPATPAELTGHWSPEGTSGSAFVQFHDDGGWTGSDGCNDTGGRWVAGSDGGFLATAATVRTLIACDDGVDVGSALATARRAALDGPALVLLDVDGATVGRYHRASGG